jgi:uncharacterized membrane protein (UPF0127 family)
MSGPYAVLNVDRDHWLGQRVSVAGTSAQRKQGLLGIDRIDRGAGIWIAPCEAIHTFGMKIAIDVIFLDRELRVKKLVPALKPWRLSVSLRAYSVLELEAGAINRTGTCLGDRLRFSRLSQH